MTAVMMNDILGNRNWEFWYECK